jgi:hypothetical protein
MVREIEVATFTVAADPDYWLNLDSLEFSYAGDIAAGSPTYTYELYTSIDGYASPVFSDSVTSDETGEPAWDKSASIELDAAEFQNLTGDITFSFRFQTTSDSRNDRLRIITTESIDGYEGFADTDLVLYGEVIPEPATLSLLGLGMLAMIRRRRTA